jgi:hypothetical protein
LDFGGGGVRKKHQDPRSKEEPTSKNQFDAEGAEKSEKRREGGETKMEEGLQKTRISRINTNTEFAPMVEGFGVDEIKVGFWIFHCFCPIYCSIMTTI